MRLSPFKRLRNVVLGPVLLLVACDPAAVPYVVQPDQAVLATTVAALPLQDLRPNQLSYNASVAQIGPHRFMAYRLDSPRRGHGKQQEIALVAIDEEYRQLGPSTLLHTPHPAGHRPSAEDPRLFVHDGGLYVIYSAKPIVGLSNKHRRMFLGRIALTDEAIPDGQMAWVRQLDVEDDAIVQARWEKNWTPFSYDGSVHLIYRTTPPLVVRVPPERLESVEWQAAHASSRNSRHALLPEELATLDVELVAPPEQQPMPQTCGRWSGGTPALFSPELGEYVSFFHSRCQANYGEGLPTKLYYMMGFYAFAPTPPFAITRFVQEPLQVPDMDGQLTGQTRIVYPSGVLDEGDNYVVSFGRDDFDIGIASFDKQELFARLRPATAPSEATDAHPSAQPDATQDTDDETVISLGQAAP